MSGAQSAVTGFDIDRHPTHATERTRGVGLHRLRHDTGTPGDLRLESLRARFAEFYECGWADGIFWAVPLFGGCAVEAGTLEGLESAVRADWCRRGGAR